MFLNIMCLQYIYFFWYQDNYTQETYTTVLKIYLFIICQDLFAVHSHNSGKLAGNTINY